MSTELLDEIEVEEQDEQVLELAVVGMAGDLPGAQDLETFWHNLSHGVESVSFFSKEELAEAGVSKSLLEAEKFVPARAVLEDPRSFDANFFGISPQQAQFTDPQHRKFLECCWVSLEDAGVVPDEFDGHIGIFAGCSMNTYLLNNLLPQREILESLGGLQAIMASDKDHLTTLASYKLGLTGPSVTIQTACSTSLVALQLAYLSLLNYQCDIALAGGVSIAVPVKGGHLYRQRDIFSPDGHCRAFDVNSRGTVSGDGCGVVALRRLEDALADGDNIRAVIKAAAINNDGNRKVGYTAPSVEGQSDVISSAMAMADISADTVSYIETHGTATAIGDPIEIAGLTRAFREDTDDVGFCAIGSVKTNIGHLNAAAGVAGVIKTVLALENQAIPPSLHFTEPNPRIKIEKTPFYVNNKLSPWENVPLPRRAGVSSFGAGGTNAHVILEEAPTLEKLSEKRQPQILPLSAKTPNALQEATQRLQKHLEEHPEQRFEDIAYTLQKGRKDFSHRLAILASSKDEVLDAIQKNDHRLLKAPLLVDNQKPGLFLFPGQGFQRVQMGYGLYQNSPVFRKELDRCFEILQPLVERDLKEVLFASPDAPGAREELDGLLYSGPAIFSVSYALARYWQAHGVEPLAVLGHSTGEYPAACIAGIMDLESAIHLLVTRAKLLETLPKGAAIHVPLAPAQIEDLLIEGTYLSLYNGPRACVVSGTPDRVESFKALLVDREISHQSLRISKAPHCPLMLPIAEAFRQEVHKYKFNAPDIPLVTAVTGTWITDEEATDPEHWVRHVLQPVRFAEAMQTFISNEDAAMIELGPRGSIGKLASYNALDRTVLPSLLLEEEESVTEAQHLAPMASLWLHGLDLDWQTLHSDERRKVRLPTYPFQRKVYWVEPPTNAIPTMAHITVETVQNANQAGLSQSGKAGQSQKSVMQLEPRPPLAVAYVAPRSHVEQVLADICAGLFAIEKVGIFDPFLELGGDSLMVLRLLERAEKRLNFTLPQEAAFQGFTVARLASFIEDHLGERKPLEDEPKETKTQEHTPEEHKVFTAPSLVPMRTTGSRRPIFFVHPATGAIFPYFELAKELGSDQPFYALQAHGLDGKTPRDFTVQAMAANYIKAIRQVQPEGPYHLGAFSFGVLIIYEMALQLEDMGEEVALLAMVDEPAPLKGHRPGYSAVAQVFLGQSGKTFRRFLHDHLYLLNKGNNKKPGIRKRKGLTGIWKSFLERSAMAMVIPEDSLMDSIEQPAMHLMAELLLIHIWAHFSYKPKRTYSGNAIVFRSEWWDSSYLLAPKSSSPTLGWEELILGDIELHQLPGDHLAILRQPSVGKLAEKMRKAFECATDQT